MAAATPTKLCNLQETSAYLNTNETNIKRWVSLGILVPAIKLSKPYFFKQTLDHFITLTQLTQAPIPSDVATEPNGYFSLHEACWFVRSRKDKLVEYVRNNIITAERVDSNRNPLFFSKDKLTELQRALENIWTFICRLDFYKKILAQQQGTAPSSSVTPPQKKGEVI